MKEKGEDPHLKHNLNEQDKRDRNSSLFQIMFLMIRINLTYFNAIAHQF